MNQESVDVNNLTKSFKGKKGHFWEPKIQILKDISFKIKEGKITGFLGANGAGKTTFLKILFQYIRQDSGEIKFSPKLGKDFIEVRNNIGYLPERPYFHPHLTGREFIYYLGNLTNLSQNKISESLLELSKILKIEYALDRELQFYSKGMLQRIGFLSALIHNPKLIILDEPMSGLDPLGRKEFKDIMRRINKEKGATIFFSTHIISDVEEIADEVIFLKDGKVNFQGSVADKLKENNVKNKFKITFQRNGIIEELFTDNLDSGLKMLISKNVDFIDVKKEKISLEEIFYISNKEI